MKVHWRPFNVRVFFFAHYISVVFGPNQWSQVLLIFLFLFFLLFVFELVLVKFQKNTLFLWPKYSFVFLYCILFLFYLCSVLKMKMNLNMMFGDRSALSSQRNVKNHKCIQLFSKKVCIFTSHFKEKKWTGKIYKTFQACHDLQFLMSYIFLVL